MRLIGIEAYFHAPASKGQWPKAALTYWASAARNRTQGPTGGPGRRSPGGHGPSRHRPTGSCHRQPASGVTLGGRFLDDVFLRPVFECAEALGAPIYLHPSKPPGAVRRAYYQGACGPPRTRCWLRRPGAGTSRLACTPCALSSVASSIASRRCNSSSATWRGTCRSC
jgi:hypothetical protein